MIMPRNAGHIPWTYTPLRLCLLMLLMTAPITGPSEDTTEFTTDTVITDLVTATDSTTATPDRSDPIATTTQPITAGPDPITAAQAPETTAPETTTRQGVTTLGSTLAAPKCPNGSIGHRDRCYSFEQNRKVSWNNAREDCQQRPGGDLLVLDSTEEQRFINDLVSFANFEGLAYLWIGLHRECSNVHFNFSWVDGVPLSQELENWESGQPNNFYSSECCVDLLAGNEKVSGIFRDVQCTTQQGYICEVPIVPPEEPPTPSPSPSLERPLETSTVMEFQVISSVVLYMTSAVQLHSSIAASSSLPQPTPSPSWSLLPSSTPTLLPGLSARPSSTPVSSDVTLQPSHDAPLEPSSYFLQTSTSFITPSVSDRFWGSESISSPVFPTPLLSTNAYNTDLTFYSSTSKFSTENPIRSTMANIYQSSTLTKQPSSKRISPVLSTFQTSLRTSSTPTLISATSVSFEQTSSQNSQTFRSTTPIRNTGTIPVSLPFEMTTQTRTTQLQFAEVTSDSPTTNHNDESVTTEATSLTSPAITDQSERASHKSTLGTIETPVMCRAEFLDGLQWEATEQNTAALQPCPENPFATVRRNCVPVNAMTAAWRQPDYSDCQTPTPGELLNRLTLLSHMESVDPDDVIKATFQLAQRLDGNSNSAEEYSVLVELLEMIAALPDKFTECGQADMEDLANSFLQAVDNILQPKNIAAWTANQEVAADTVRIMDAVESFTAQTATENCELSLTSQEDAPAFFEGKYDRIVFRKSQETPSGFGGLSYSASSPPASIRLPPNIFQAVTDQQVTLLVVVYPTIGDLLDSVQTPVQPSPGSTMQVKSAVVTLSGVHQSGQAFDKLSVPLCINFTKKNPTFGKEESCVYLSRTESGESQWLTDGCWMNEQKNGSVQCCCNHMTSFALLSATETVEPYHLLLLTYVLCSASCFIILLSALILFSVRHLNTVSLTVHVSLALSIILSFVVIMAGLERTTNQVVCRMLAVATHYLLTSQFVWSLEGALQVCSMASSERQEQRVFQLWIYHVIGWCGPLLPVGICVALWLEEYGGAERCWFSNNAIVGLITSLGIPALINILVFVYISGKNVPTGTTLQSGTDENHTARQSAMDGLRSNVLILALLCICWSFGIAAFQLQDDVLQQAFAVSALLLGVFFFMMFLVFSHDVRQAILHGRKKRRRKNKMKLRQRISDDSLMTNSTNPDRGESRQHVHVQPLSRHDRSLGSTSTTLSQHNTHSIGTNCTDLAGEPIHEEGYGPYRRGNGAPSDLAMNSRNVGFDQRMLPWNNLGLIRGGPESLGDRSPQRVRRGERSPDVVRRSRREASPRTRRGNVILNHRIVRDAEEDASTEDEPQHKKRHRKRNISSVSGGSHSVDMACMPFPMDWRDMRSTRVHPMPIDSIPYSTDYNQGLAPSQYIQPRLAAGFLVQPHRALPGPTPSTSHGMGQLPEPHGAQQDLGAFQRSLGYYGNERRSMRESLYDGHHQAGESFRMPFSGHHSSRTGYQGRRQEPDDGNHRNWDGDAEEVKPGPSGYGLRGDSIDSQTSARSSEGGVFKDEGTEGHSRKDKGHGSSKRKSRGHGGKKHKQKSNRTEEV